MNDILEYFDIPNSCKVSKKLDKKEFIENFQLNVNDRKVLSKVIERITLEYLLNQDTINISTFSDEEKDYSEIAIIKVKITDKSKLKTINKIIQEIPYPLIVVYQCESEISICISSKRINKSDSSKLVVEEDHFTDWINLEELNDLDIEFLNNLKSSQHSFVDFFSFYESYLKLVIAYNVSKYSGSIKKSDNSKEILSEIHKVELQISELKNKIKKETNFNDKVGLNIKLKKLNDNLKKLKSSL